VALLQNLKAAEGEVGKRPIQELFEFEWTDGTSHLRMEANPNLFTNAFNAKVFVMFEDGQMRMSSQVRHPYKHRPIRSVLPPHPPPLPQVSLPDLVDTVKDFKAKNAA
jgi:hypothetical protein